MDRIVTHFLGALITLGVGWNFLFIGGTTLATEAYRYCAQEAIQLHGGVGFTWEYDPQLHFKRAQWASQWLGASSAWRETLAAQLFDVA